MKKFDKIYKLLYIISLIIIFLNNHNYFIFNRTTNIIINVISIYFYDTYYIISWYQWF